MADKCSGTFGEAWRGSESRDHHMFSSVDAFIHFSLSGLMPDENPRDLKRYVLNRTFRKESMSFPLTIQSMGKDWKFR